MADEDSLRLLCLHGHTHWQRTRVVEPSAPPRLVLVRRRRQRTFGCPTASGRLRGWSWSVWRRVPARRRAGGPRGTPRPWQSAEQSTQNVRYRRLSCSAICRRPKQQQQISGQWANIHCKLSMNMSILTIHDKTRTTLASEALFFSFTLESSGSLSQIDGGPCCTSENTPKVCKATSKRCELHAPIQ